jgi:DNA-binding response OmpR family regulator
MCGCKEKDYKHAPPCAKKQIVYQLNGLQCFRGLKEINHGVKAIVASGYDDGSDRRTMANEGVGAFVQKPFKVVELAKKIRELINSTSAQ